jgi:hypothetical protein
MFDITHIVAVLFVAIPTVLLLVTLVVIRRDAVKYRKEMRRQAARECAMTTDTFDPFAEFTL